VPGRSGGADRPQPGEEMQENQHAGLVESLATSKVTAHKKGRPTTTGNMKTDQAETGGNRQGRLNGSQPRRFADEVGS
jgi:hypothetical protein